MNHEIRTAFESGFGDLNYSVSAFFKRLWLRLLNHWQHGGSQRAAQNLVMQNRHKEARTLLDRTERTIQARRRLIRQLK